MIVASIQLSSDEAQEPVLLTKGQAGTRNEPGCDTSPTAVSPDDLQLLSPSLAPGAQLWNTSTISPRDLK